MNTTGKLVDISYDYMTKKPKVTFLIDSIQDVEELQNIERLTIEAKKYRKQRSLDANAYFHVLVNKLARKIGMSDQEMKVKLNLEYGTVARNKDGTIRAVKVPYGTDLFELYPYWKKFGECIENNMTWEKFMAYKPTHELDTKEMAQLIDGVVSECKEQGIETLPEDELKSLLGEWKHEKQT